MTGRLKKSGMNEALDRDEAERNPFRHVFAVLDTLVRLHEIVERPGGLATPDRVAPEVEWSRVARRLDAHRASALLDVLGLLPMIHRARSGAWYEIAGYEGLSATEVLLQLAWETWTRADVEDIGPHSVNPEVLASAKAGVKDLLRRVQFPRVCGDVGYEAELVSDVATLAKRPKRDDRPDRPEDMHRDDRRLLVLIGKGVCGTKDISRRMTETERKKTEQQVSNLAKRLMKWGFLLRQKSPFALADKARTWMSQLTKLDSEGGSMRH